MVEPVTRRWTSRRLALAPGTPATARQQTGHREPSSLSVSSQQEGGAAEGPWWLP